MPLGEIVMDFFDQLKSRSAGYTSPSTTSPPAIDPANLVKVDVLLNAVPVDAFSTVVHRDKAYEYGKHVTDKLREFIPRQLFNVPLQAASVAVSSPARRSRRSERTSSPSATAAIYAQAQAARESEGGETPNEADRPRRGAEGGVRRRTALGGLMVTIACFHSHTGPGRARCSWLGAAPELAGVCVRRRPARDRLVALVPGERRDPGVHIDPRRVEPTCAPLRAEHRA